MMQWSSLVDKTVVFIQQDRRSIHGRWIFCITAVVP